MGRDDWTARTDRGADMPSTAPMSSARHHILQAVHAQGKTSGDSFCSASAGDSRGFPAARY